MASDFPYGAYVGLHISTPEEMKRRYEQTEEKEIRDYRLKTLDEFVKSWKVKYFFNYSFKWDLRKLYKLLPGLGNLVDHGIGFVDKEILFFYCSHMQSQMSFGNIIKFVSM